MWEVCKDAVLLSMLINFSSHVPPSSFVFSSPFNSFSYYYLHSPTHHTIFTKKLDLMSTHFDRLLFYPYIHPSIRIVCMYAASEQGVKGNWLWFDYQFNLSWKTEIVRVCCVGCAGWDDGMRESLLLCVLVGFIPPTHIYPKEQRLWWYLTNSTFTTCFLSSHSQTHIKIQPTFTTNCHHMPCAYKAIQHMTKKLKEGKNWTESKK